MSAPLTVESVLAVLRPVEDPELRRSLVELNMIRDVAIEDGTVRFTLVLTTPACPYGNLLSRIARRPSLLCRG